MSAIGLCLLVVEWPIEWGLLTIRTQARCQFDYGDALKLSSECCISSTAPQLPLHWRHVKLLRNRLNALPGGQSAGRALIADVQLRSIFQSALVLLQLLIGVQFCGERKKVHRRIHVRSYSPPRYKQDSLMSERLRSYISLQATSITPCHFQPVFAAREGIPYAPPAVPTMIC